MSEIEIKERNIVASKKLVTRLAKAIIITAAFGIFFLIIWSIASPLLTSYPHYLTLFTILVWVTLFFTFATRLTEGTIYKHTLVIGQAFFMILYLIYATNGGFLTFDFADLHFTIELTPLLALVIVPNLLAMAKGILEMLEFTSGVPKE